MFRDMPKNKLYPIIIILVSILLIGGAIFISANKDSNAPKLPSTISEKILFNPYLPSKLPKNYKVEQSSFKMQEDALLFEATNGSGRKLYISEQALPKDFNLEKFYKENIKGPSRVSGSKMTTVYGTPASQRGIIVSIVSPDNTWIIVTSPEAFSKSEVASISQNFAPQ